MNPLSITHAARAEGAAELPALLAEGRSLSYGELAAQAARLASALAREGVTAGSRVALRAESRIETVIAIHALLELGATLVPVHPRLTEAEVAAQLADAAPHLVLREDDLADRLAPRASAEASLSPPRALDPELPLAMVYTSGTSGKPKGAVLSRRAFAASAAGSAQNLGWELSDRWLACMPLCHVGGLSILTRCLLARRPLILLPRFDARAVLEAIARDRATILSVVPTMLAALLEDDRGLVLGELRAMLVGGAAAPRALLEECARRGVPALTTYGLTEACSQATVQRPRSPRLTEPGSGTPLAGVNLRIAGDDGGSLGALEVGRIELRGPVLMSGYFRGPDRPLDQAVSAQGFFDTGDVGCLDEEGRLHVHARRTDLIVTGGENVYPVEVEQCLEELPFVRRALCFGVPDPRWGQVVACALEVERSPPPPGALFSHVSSRLASHKRPRLYCAVEALPLTGSGKVLRAGAVERYLAELAPLGP